MSDDIVLHVDDVSKMYILGQHTGGNGLGLRHQMHELATLPLRLIQGKKQERLPAEKTEFWALKDISFDITRGEVVGIIGRNGAGKSTLLKILSRITEPTRGRIGIKGRVASLLEVGTGFHPELTGRENIFLNGAILGMTQREVRLRFDEIVAFAGVEKFLDTPVKRYSSGMYVRLAFAVAAHLEPEILIVDEVLAVGDTEFQKKCLGKMREVTHGGRTVLFVSHNLSAMAALCNRGIYLKSGQVVTTGAMPKVLDAYKNDLIQAPTATEASVQARRGTGSHRVESVKPAHVEFPAREPISFHVKIRHFQDEGNFHFSLHVRNEWGAETYSLTTEFLTACRITSGDSEFELTVEYPWLPPGEYHLETYLYGGGIIDHWPQACHFRIGVDLAKNGYSHVLPAPEATALATFHVTQ